MTLSESSLIKQKSIGIVILAAGSSSRLGRPKQLITFQGRSLVQRMIDCADSLQCKSKVLVLGAYPDEIQKHIDTKSFKVKINEDWQKGMSGSLSVGLQEARKITKEIEAILILVSDQPFVSKELLEELIRVHVSADDIIASKYQEITGVPAIFGKVYFDELLNLTGDQGAKKVLRAHMDKVKTVPFKHGDFDVDTDEDVKRLNEWERE